MNIDTNDELTPNGNDNDTQNINTNNSAQRNYYYYDSCSQQTENTESFIICDTENDTELHNVQAFTTKDIINSSNGFKTIREKKMKTANIITRNFKYDGNINIRLLDKYGLKNELRMKVINNKLHSLYYIHCNGYENEVIMDYDKNGVSQMTPKRFKRKFDAFRKRIERKNQAIQKRKNNQLIDKKRGRKEKGLRGRYEQVPVFNDLSDNDNDQNGNEQRVDQGYNNGSIWRSRRLRNQRKKLKKNKLQIQFLKHVVFDVFIIIGYIVLIQKVSQNLFVSWCFFVCHSL